MQDFYHPPSCLMGSWSKGPLRTVLSRIRSMPFFRGRGRGGEGEGGRKRGEGEGGWKGVEGGEGGGGECWPGLFTNLFTNSMLKEKRERAPFAKQTLIVVHLSRKLALFLSVTLEFVNRFVNSMQMALGFANRPGQHFPPPPHSHPLPPGSDGTNRGGHAGLQRCARLSQKKCCERGLKA